MREREDDILKLLNGLHAAIRWTENDTAKIIFSDRDVREEGFNDGFCNDVFLIREALKVKL